MDIPTATAFVAVYDGAVGIWCRSDTDEAVLLTQVLKGVIRALRHQGHDVGNGLGGDGKLLDALYTGFLGIHGGPILDRVLRALARIGIVADLPVRPGLQEHVYVEVVVSGAGLPDIVRLDAIAVSMGLHEGQKPLTHQVVKGACVGRSFCSGHWNPVASPELSAE
ncbi:hypothetical protein AD929_03555 [Gluconobacter potus]|uniref:Uncharacterized protein n=1 Tax=Gluconobacter potus TaxID=2724927 RepID=A0A149QY05_9PROT|nr:hypothetical protein AD929_03555 [Gluconobacter potus]